MRLEISVESTACWTTWTTSGASTTIPTFPCSGWTASWAAASSSTRRTRERGGLVHHLDGASILMRQHRSVALPPSTIPMGLPGATSASARFSTRTEAVPTRPWKWDWSTPARATTKWRRTTTGQSTSIPWVTMPPLSSRQPDVLLLDIDGTLLTFRYRFFVKWIKNIFHVFNVVYNSHLVWSLWSIPKVIYWPKMIILSEWWQ